MAGIGARWQAVRGIATAVLLCGVLLPQARAAELLARFSDARGNPVANAVVYLEPLDAAASVPMPMPEQQLALIDQINKEFVPRVVAVAAGTQVNFPNKDDIHHHVYSFSEARKFELPLYEGTPAQPVSFDAPGVVTLGCNIHDWMRGYVLVLQTPYFATSGDDGAARITAVADGSYRLMAWHPELKQGGSLAGESLLAQGDSSHVASFTLELKPALRIRRAPAARGGDRY
jgi:plastocyanin